MTKEEKLQTIMELKGIEEVEVDVDFTTDKPIRRRSFEDYYRVKDFHNKCQQTIAERLGVSPNILKGCDTDDAVALMETIFWIEANGENDVYVRNNKIVLDIPKLYPYLEAYRVMKGAAEMGAIPKEEYLNWKLNWDRDTMPSQN
jgi:hypothetical protein